MEAQPEDGRPSKDWLLQKESELRVEVGEQDSVDIRLISGTAEVFGTELAKNKTYCLTAPTKLAIFTWYGCSLRVFGEPEVAYLSDATPMVMYLNAHMAVDQMRTKNEAEGKIGAKVLMVGPTDVGKSSICKILLNYAVKMGRQPCLVDLDVGQGLISMPGSMGLLPIERPCDIESGEFTKRASMVYHFGHSSPAPNIKLYNTVVTAMAEMFKKRCDTIPKAKTGGCVINTCGWVDGGGYKALLHAAEAFEVDVVFVLDHERLFHDLQRQLPQSTQIVPLRKSGGVVVRSREFRRQCRLDRLRAYFYGQKPHNFFPFSFDVALSDIEIFKIGAPAVPESALPIGMEKEDGSTQLLPLEPSRELVHCILSLSMATSKEEDLVTTCSAGFICVTAVDLEKHTVTVLSPAPRPLPRKYLLLTELKFVDLR